MGSDIDAGQEQVFGLKIRTRLNAGTANLVSSVSERLFKARQQALSHHTARVGELSLAGLGRHVFSLGGDYARPLFAALALVTVVICGDYVTSMQRASHLEEVDSALLADDLPSSAYLDRGFDAWLNSSAQH